MEGHSIELDDPCYSLEIHTQKWALLKLNSPQKNKKQMEPQQV